MRVRGSLSCGWIFAAHQLGAARAAVGDCAVAFDAAGILAILAGGMALLIRRAPGAAVRPAA